MADATTAEVPLVRSGAFDLKWQPGFGVVTMICLVLLYAPMIVLFVFSFNGSDSITRWGGLPGWRWYTEAFADEEFRSAAMNTIKITVVATIISTLAATAAAIGTTRGRQFAGQGAIYTVVNLPLMVPEIITAIATLSFFALLAQYGGINFGIGNLMLAHTVFCIPFAYMPIRARLEGMDERLEQAAADLYATPWQAFKRVTLPLLVPGISAGTALAFIVSFDDFTITQLVAGPGQTTLPLYIWAKTRRPLTPELNAMCTILLAISILFVVTSFLIANRRRSKTE